MTEQELRDELARLAAERKAAWIRYDVDRVLAIREEMGKITAQIHRLQRERRQQEAAR